jgi:hypothetical protein
MKIEKIAAALIALLAPTVALAADPLALPNSGNCIAMSKQITQRVLAKKLTRDLQNQGVSKPRVRVRATLASVSNTAALDLANVFQNTSLLLSSGGSSSSSSSSSSTGSSSSASSMAASTSKVIFALPSSSTAKIKLCTVTYTIEARYSGRYPQNPSLATRIQGTSKGLLTVPGTYAPNKR